MTIEPRLSCSKMMDIQFLKYEERLTIMIATLENGYIVLMRKD